MSAFVCNDKHIAELALYYADQTGEDAQEVADTLKDANIRAVNFRYDINDPIEPCELPQAASVGNPVHIIKMCNCLNYQSAELSEWADEDAYHIILAVIAFACSNLHGYDDAPWEYMG